MGKVVVTGGAGTIGGHIVDRLLDLNVEQVVVLDNFARGRKENLQRPDSRLRLAEADIRDPKVVSDAIRGADVVFHQAALRITRCAEEPRLALEVMVDGTFNVLEAAVEHGVRKVVAASSASVYGQADQFPTPETHHPYNNRTFYGAAKTFNEGMLRSFHEMFGLDYVALRYFNVYGPGMDISGPHTEVLIRWIERIEAGSAPLIFGDGSHTMDFAFVTDIAEANILAAQSDVSDEVFNVASGVETSLLELARALAGVLGRPIEPEFGPERSVNPVPRRLADPSAALDRLGFRAKVSLEDGLRQLVAWWRDEKEKERVAP